MNSRNKVSIIIPCFNQGVYLEKTVESVLKQTYSNFEIIIVNDGSTDKVTNSILNNANWQKTTIYNIENSGVAAARNFGIKKSNGIYILPLDGDDLIAPKYLEKAVCILDSDSKIKVVTCRTELFGAKSGEFILPEYNLEMLIAQNVLVCTSMFRREDFAKTHGYNPNMKLGLEDWDFWISLLGKNDGDVYKIDEVLFYYRINKKSRNSTMTSEIMETLRKQIFKNNRDVYSNNFLDPKKTFEYNLLSNSMEYRLGLILIKPIRKIRRILNSFYLL